MRQAILALSLFAANAFSQGGSFHFMGDVSYARDYRKEFGPGLVFLLMANGDGWTIGIASKSPCAADQHWTAVLNLPFRGYNALCLDTSYGHTAQQAVAFNPREFRFVLSCAAYRRESSRLNIVLWPYNYSQSQYDDALAKLGTSPQGSGKLTILQSRISRADEDIGGRNYGKIDWLKFKVDISTRPSKPEPW